MKHLQALEKLVDEEVIVMDLSFSLKGTLNEIDGIFKINRNAGSVSFSDVRVLKIENNKIWLKQSITD